MPLYMFQGRYSTNSIKSLIENPEDRAGPAGDLIASLGGKVELLALVGGAQRQRAEHGARRHVVGAVLLLGHAPGDPDGAAAVGHAGGEVVDGARLVEAGQAALVVLA